MSSAKKDYLIHRTTVSNCDDGPCLDEMIKRLGIKLSGKLNKEEKIKVILKDKRIRDLNMLEFFNFVKNSRKLTICPPTENHDAYHLGPLDCKEDDDKFTTSEWRSRLNAVTVSNCDVNPCLDGILEVFASAHPKHKADIFGHRGLSPLLH
jgi:hypothetical protein